MYFSDRQQLYLSTTVSIGPGGGALGYFLGGYVPPGTPNWHPVLKKNPLKLIPRSRNGLIFYTPFQKVCKLKQPCCYACVGGYSLLRLYRSVPGSKAIDQMHVVPWQRGLLITYSHHHHCVCTHAVLNMSIWQQ